MDKIFNKLHSYDIMGYFIPGLFTISYVIFGLSLLKYSINLFDKNIFTNSIVFFVFCYITGLLIQEIGSIIERYELKKIFKDTYSENILKKDSQIIPLTDKIKCWNILKKHFKIPIDLHIKDKNKLSNKIGEYGHICYTRCRETLKYAYRSANILNQSEIFNIHYGMSRNLLVSTLLGIIYFSIITIFLTLKTGQVYILCMILFLIMYFCSKLFYRRSQRYAKYHVNNTIALYLATYDNLEAPQIITTR